MAYAVAVWRDAVGRSGIAVQTCSDVELVEAVEFGTEPVGVGRVKMIEDDNCLLPDGTGGSCVADGVVGVAEVGEGLGQAVAVAEVVIQLDGVLKAGDGLGVVAEVVVDVAEAVPGASLSTLVA
jgi:hypothetical protein